MIEKKGSIIKKAFSFFGNDVMATKPPKRKNIKEIERRMENMCKQYDIARRAMKRFEDDWVMVGSYSKK